MHTANQNIALREHKRRVVAFVESTIAEEALGRAGCLSNWYTWRFYALGNQRKMRDLQGQGT